MVEAGIFARFRRKWFPFENCTNHKTESTVKLGLDRIGGVFVLYSGVAVAAALVLIAERTYFKLKEPNFM